MVCGLRSENEARRALAMVDDRNLTSHTYPEALAVAIAGRLPEHTTFPERWLASTRRTLDDAGRSPAPKLS